MPLRHQPHSLRKTALRCIADNFDRICYNCCDKEDMLKLDSETYMDVQSPLYDMPSQIIEELAEELKHLTHLRGHHLHILIPPTLLAWASDGIADQMMAFHLLGTRCQTRFGVLYPLCQCVATLTKGIQHPETRLYRKQKLKQLTMAYVRHLNHKVLLNLLPNLSSLVILDLRMTLTVDEVMGKIGEHCKELVDLNISGTPITDRGLIQLCVSEYGERRCQKLARLVVNETWVTSAGAAVALQSLPNLREFDFDNIFEAIEQVETWDSHTEMCLLAPAGVRVKDTPSMPPTHLKLATLTSTSEYVREEGLDCAVRLCPEVTAVSLTNAWLPNDSLYKLMVLDHLTTLSLTNCEGYTFDFYEGVLPLLSVCGPRLHSLILTNFLEVDVAGVGKTCPKLHNLAFSNVSVYETPSQPCSDWFNNLEAMELWADTGAELSPNLVKQLLLFSPDLKNLLFNGCAVLTDKLLSEIWEANQMKCLSHLTLDHCHGVTADILNYLLDSENELTVLRIWSCASITKLHSILISQRIEQENMDVYFEWFQYNSQV